MNDISGRERAIGNINYKCNGPAVEAWCSAATWYKYREQLFPYAKRLPNDFTLQMDSPPDYDSFQPGYKAGDLYTDVWGCEWSNKVNGMQGIITKFPLEDWDSFANYKFPDTNTTLDLNSFDLENTLKYFDILHKHGKFSMIGAERLWERVHFLRGYENSLMDMADNDPRIRTLISNIVEYNIKSVSKFVDYENLDCIAFQDDWGEQNRLMVSPNMWHDFFFEGYKAMFGYVKKHGKYVYFHTDGHLLPVIPYLIEAGADIINIQSGCNDLKELKYMCKDNVSVSVDTDRQYFMPYASPNELKGHIFNIYEAMEGSRGGLWFKADIYPDTPLENINAISEALDELRKF